MSISLPCVPGAILLTALLGSGAAFGATINYSEAVDGQLSAFATSLGAAGNGTNTVAGSLNGICDVTSCNESPDGASGNSQDTFKIQILPGSSLTSLFVTTSNVVGPTNFTASFQQGGNVFVPFLPLGSTTANLLNAALGPGTYTMTLYGQGSSVPGPYSLDYSVAFNVVPIPAAAWLFGGALGLMGWLRRKPATAS